MIVTYNSADVIESCLEALFKVNPDAAVKTVADAFTAQKQIVVAIQRILAEHMREQEAAEISRQLHELADRQAQSAEVKGFAKHMITDHTKLRDQLLDRRLSSDLGLFVQLTSNESAREHA